MVTGANGNLGRRLIKNLLLEDEVVAVVRSNKAAETVTSVASSPAEKAHLTVKVLDYTDVAALREAATGCTSVVHLVGILKETAQASYVAAHEDSCEALVAATADSSVQHITYLSIVGSKATAVNACLASKGKAEDILRSAPIPTAILRVPMVLGEGDYASFALKKRASQSLSFTFRADSMEQPVYAGDVVKAIFCAAKFGINEALDLGGPEALTRRDLTQRASQASQRTTRVLSLPVGVGYALAGLLGMISSNPPFTRAMLGVLDHDDVVASEAGWQTLNIDELTPLDNMLEKILT